MFADMAEYLGDPDFVDIDMDKLLADKYIERRAAEVNPSEISQLNGVKPGLESPDTTHYSIVDQWVMLSPIRIQSIGILDLALSLIDLSVE